MKFDSEEQIKHELGIDSWRNLSREKVIQFAAIMPDMDKEVMMEIIDKFPEFSQFAKEVLDNIEEGYEETISANSENQKDIHKTFADVRRILEKQLDKDDLSFEEKRYFTDKIVECMDKEDKKDSENKKFLSDIHRDKLVAAGSVVAAALIFVGGKVFLGKNKV